MNVPAKNSLFSICTILIATLCAANLVSAASIAMLDISGTGARSFSDPTIWPDSTVPASSDFPTMAYGDGIIDYVYIDSIMQLVRVNVGNQNSGGLELRSGAFLHLEQAGGQTNIGPSGSATGALPGIGYLRIKSGATLEQTGVMYLGLNTQGTGTITLEAGGTHLVGGQLLVGSAGTGTYNLAGSLTNSASNVVVGSSLGGIGTLNMTGGSLKTTVSNVIVGNAGAGTFNMSAGTLTTGTYLEVGNAATGNGTFKQSDGIVQLNRSDAVNRGLYIGFTAGSTGLYEISGGTLNVANTNAGVINGTNAAGGGSAATLRVVGSAPTITIGKNYLQRSGATLDFVIGASGISPLNLGGNSTLDSGSILSASFTAMPTVGQEFTIVNYAGTNTGAFTTFDSLVDSPLGPNTVQLAIDYGTGTASSIKLTVSSIISAHPGDVDGDGDVDGADFVAWQTNFPTVSGATKAQGDADGDGDVDGADFVVWQTNFPYTPGPGASPVPEPNGLLLLATMSVGLAAIYQRRRVARLWTFQPELTSAVIGQNAPPKAESNLSTQQ